MSGTGNVNLRSEIMHGASAQKVVYRPRVNAVLVAPTGTPTVRIRAPGGAATAIVAGPCTVSGGSIIYSLDASSTTLWPLGSDYWADFTYVNGSDTEVVRTTFDIVLQPLVRFCPFDAEDVKGADPRVDSYLASSQKMTDNLPGMILRAWEDVYLWVRSREQPRPYLISDARVLYSVTRYRALYWIAMAMSEDSPHFKELADSYDDSYEKAKMLTQLEYAPDGTRSVDVLRAVQQPRLHTGPDRSRGGVIDETFWRRAAGLPGK